MMEGPPIDGVVDHRFEYFYGNWKHAGRLDVVTEREDFS